MTFDEWWATKNVEDAEVPGILKKGLKDLAYESWCESVRYHQSYAQGIHCALCGCDIEPATIICIDCRGKT